eukprot:6471402-Amphidinium_carterae.1
MGFPVLGRVCHMVDVVLEAQLLQPSGPYIFIGHSFGATLCLEMARLVEANGDKVQPPMYSDVLCRCCINLASSVCISRSQPCFLPQRNFQTSLETSLRMLLLPAL